MRTTGWMSGVFTTQRWLKRIALTMGVVAFVLLLCDRRSTGAGIAAMRPLERWTGEHDWILASAKTLFSICTFSTAAAILLLLLRFPLKWLLLSRRYAATAVVCSLGQSGLRINRVPQMRVDLEIATLHGPVKATLRQFFDLGNMPRPGDRLPVWVSKLDPTCVSLRTERESE